MRRYPLCGAGRFAFLSPARRWLALTLIVPGLCLAAPPNEPPNRVDRLASPDRPAPPASDPFYRQLIDLRAPAGYRPTRTFTVIRDDQGDRLVARDDAQLAFNMLWLAQHRTGYRYREGGAALGKLVRTILKSAYKNYREDNAERLSGMPDAEGVGELDYLSSEMDYDFRLSDDEVTIGFEYRY